MMYKLLTIIFIFLISLSQSIKADWVCSSNSKSPFEIEVDAISGLDDVYVVYAEESFYLKFITSQLDDISVFRFTNSISNSEKIEYNLLSDGIEIINPIADYGYYIKSGERNLGAVWITNYNPKNFSLNSIIVDNESSDCEFVRIILDRSSENLNYVTVTGAVKSIKRELIVDWTTLEWNNESLSFQTKAISESYNDAKEITVDAPLCNTSFKVSGDQFLKYWDILQSVETEVYNAVNIEGMAFAEQTVNESDNQISSETSEFGGSAPVEIDFSGFFNEPVTTYYAWEISNDKDFENIEYTFTDSNLNYSFTDEGLKYVRFVISNSMNSCEKVVESFTIDVSESSLKVPNVFTPGSDTENNLIFKVAYRSIIKFEAWVYNRWGNELFHWKDPNEGWDGTYKGKLMPTGAYYYIIKAEGSGGKKYNLKGDINLLRTKKVN
ncbi:MAG: gliding motility-associated C-terminal domain-containing protein [Bacteroidales bacterium]|nr:gliding motility-associated C-terminal domain-containing protein [Bacteroidales bacterium]